MKRIFAICCCVLFLAGCAVTSPPEAGTDTPAPQTPSAVEELLTPVIPGAEGLPKDDCINITKSELPFTSVKYAPGSQYLDVFDASSAEILIGVVDVIPAEGPEAPEAARLSCRRLACISADGQTLLASVLTEQPVQRAGFCGDGGLFVLTAEQTERGDHAVQLQRYTAGGAYGDTVFQGVTSSLLALDLCMLSNDTAALILQPEESVCCIKCFQADGTEVFSAENRIDPDRKIVSLGLLSLSNGSFCGVCETADKQTETDVLYKNLIVDASYHVTEIGEQYGRCLGAVEDYLICVKDAEGPDVKQTVSVLRGGVCVGQKEALREGDVILGVYPLATGALVVKTYGQSRFLTVADGKLCEQLCSECLYRDLFPLNDRQMLQFAATTDQQGTLYTIAY